MVENRPLLSILAHIVLLLGVAIVALPVWITFVGASHEASRMLQTPIPMLPGDQFFVNLRQTLWGSGLAGTETAPVWMMLMNSMIMALMIAIGKIAISLLSAFAIVYFKFPSAWGSSG
jgi:sn-glycerol 3-phosphate transport system permease protein